MTLKRGLGFNIDGMFSESDDRYALKEKMRLSNPGAVVVLSNLDYAIELKNALPHTVVGYRQFWGHEYDNIFVTTAPDDYIYRYRDALRAGLAIYTNNEPSQTLDPQHLANWEYEVARKVLELGGKSIHLNWSVGVPNEQDTFMNMFKPILQLIGNNRGKLFWGVHEYFFGHPFVEFGLDHRVSTWNSATIGPEAKPWIIGRYRWTLDFCDHFQIRRPQIVITEFGWDTVPALIHHAGSMPHYQFPYRIPRIIPGLEVWGAGEGMSWERYGSKMFQSVWQKIYAPSNDIVGACVFPFGGHGAWDEMSLHRHEPLVNMLSFDYDYSTALNNATEQPPVVIPPTVGQGIKGMNLGKPLSVKWTGIGMNLRVEPKIGSTPAPLMVIKSGAVGTLYTTKTATADNYNWMLAQFKNPAGEICIGWFASNYPGVKWEVIP